MAPNVGYFIRLVSEMVVTFPKQADWLFGCFGSGCGVLFRANFQLERELGLRPMNSKIVLGKPLNTTLQRTIVFGPIWNLAPTWAPLHDHPRRIRDTFRRFLFCIFLLRMRLSAKSTARQLRTRNHGGDLTEKAEHQNEIYHSQHPRGIMTVRSCCSSERLFWDCLHTVSIF